MVPLFYCSAALKQRMERDVDEVGRISRFIKGKIEEIDREVRRRVEYIVAFVSMICSSCLRVGLISSESGEPD